MGFTGLALFLAGAFTDTPAVVVLGIVLMLIQLDRWRQTDKKEQS